MRVVIHDRVAPCGTIVGVSAWTEREIERMRQRRDWLDEKISNKERYIARQEELLQEHEEKLRNARNDSFVNRVEGWIEEAAQRLENAKDELRELEKQLAEIIEKLDRN